MLLIAGALAAATMGEDAGKRLLRVYPTEDVRNDRSAAVEYELAIDSTGKLAKCTPIRAVGDERLAAKLCAIVEAARFRYTPAIDRDGVPTYGVIHTTSSFYLPDTRLGRAIRDHHFDPEVQVFVQSLPEAMEDPSDVKVVTIIGADGKVTLCEPAPNSPASLAAVACEQVQAHEWSKVADVDGTGVSYVRSFAVRFTVERGKHPAS